MNSANLPPSKLFSTYLGDLQESLFAHMFTPPGVFNLY